MSKPRFEDLACPRCGQSDAFHVDITAVAYLDCGGPSVEDEYHWDDSSDCACLQCQMEGKVADFVKPALEVAS